MPRPHALSGLARVRYHLSVQQSPMVVTDSERRLLWCSPARPASCADVTHARQLGLVGLLVGGLAVEILADADDSAKLSPHVVSVSSTGSPT